MKREALAEIEEEKRSRRGKAGKLLGFGGDLLDLSVAIQTGYEMSAVLRQGLMYSTGFPVQAARALRNSVLAAFSRRADFALHDDLMSRPNHLDYMTGGMETTADSGPLSSREELIRSRLASALIKTEHWALSPARWAAEGLLASERAFRSFGNTMRADLFDYQKSIVEANRPGTWSEDDAKVIANSANVFSGRAPLKHSVALGRVFWAPRWVWSRALLLVGQPMWKGDRATRLAVGKVYVRAALGMATFQIIKHVIYSLMAGDDEDKKPKYEINPISSDFGKTRLGETRLDSGAGLNQLITFAARLASGRTKKATGEIVPIRGDDVPFGGMDARDIIHNLVDSKLATLPAMVIDFAVGENIVGEKATIGKVAVEKLSPMTWRDIWDAEKELGIPQGTVAAIEAFFGTSVSTYGPRTKYRDATPDERQEQYEKDLENMKWDSPAPAYSEFLTPEQMEKVVYRQKQVKGNVIQGAFREPDRESYETDKKYQDAVKKRDTSLDTLKEMAKNLTYEEAVEALQKSFKDEYANARGTMKPSYERALDGLDELYGK